MARLRALTFGLSLLVLGAPAAEAALPKHAKVVREDGGGPVRFLGSAPGKPLTAPAATPGAAGRALLEGNARAFGLGRGSSLKQLRTEEQPKRGNAVRFQQSVDGVEVLGGQFVVQVDAQNRVLSVVGEAEDAPDVDTQPALSAARAEVQAVAAVAKHEQVHAARLRTSGTALKLFNDAILGGPGEDRARLVWATTVSDGAAVARLVLVDAARGGIAASIDETPHAKSRQVCDANNTTAHLPCVTPVLSEGGSTAGHATDVVSAYTYSGATYDYLLDKFGRDSLDGKGLPLKSTVRYCDPKKPCPFQNAFWSNQDRQMTYGAGYASADDIVGHELAHGLTDFTSDLYYYFQSGAINESMSDVFGELIDHVTPSPDDAPANRWQMGETLGPLRDMADPGVYGDPDSMTDSDYLVTTGDGGGVHTNSGVNNKAAFLMVDGGTHNGVTVTGIGADKVAQVYYAVQTGFLTSASDYKDLGLALPQACDNLIGSHGITATDCQEVRDAVTATRMLSERAEATDMPECPAGQVPDYLYLDQIDETATGWSLGGTDPKWYVDALYATSGRYSLGAYYDQSGAADFSAAQTASRTIPANAFLRFSHTYEFEYGLGGTMYDGGVVEVSTNGGLSWADALPAGMYDGQLDAGNALGVRPAFGRVSHGYSTAVVPLSALAGQSARFRFRYGADSSTGSWGWDVDDVGVYTCLTPTEPAVVTGSSSAITAATATVAGSVDPNGLATTYRVQYGAGGALDRETAAVGAGAGTAPVAVTVPLAGLAPGTSYGYRIVATNAKGTATGNTVTFTTAAAPAGGGGTGGTGGTGGGGTPTVVAPGVRPSLPASLSGTAKAVKKGVKAARVSCANAAGRVTCKVTFAGAKRKRKVSGELRTLGAVVAKGSIKKAGAAGAVTLTGAKSLAAGPYDLVVKVGRRSYKFKVTLG